MKEEVKSTILIIAIFAFYAVMLITMITQ